MMQELTLGGVKKAARRFYRQKKLTAQHPNRKKRRCVYLTEDSYRCAIGAALNKETIRRAVIKGGSVEVLVACGIVSVSPEEMGPIIRIQDTHDRWVRGGRQLKAKFLALIDLA